MRMITTRLRLVVVLRLVVLLRDLLDDANAQYPFFGESDIPHANGLDSEIIEIEVDRIKQLASGQERQQEAERIELAVRAQVAGVSTVSVSEQTGTVLVEASAMPWLRAGEEDDDEWVGRLEAAVLSAIRSVNHIGRSTSARNVDIEAEVAASQMEMREVMQHQQPQPRTHDWDWASVLQKPAAGGDGGEAAEAMEAEEEDEGSWQQHDQAGSPKDGEASSRRRQRMTTMRSRRSLQTIGVMVKAGTTAVMDLEKVRMMRMRRRVAAVLGGAYLSMTAAAMPRTRMSKCLWERRLRLVGRMPSVSTSMRRSSLKRRTLRMRI